MLSHRRRGLSNMYIVLVGLLMVIIFWGYEKTLAYIPNIKLSGDVNMGRYRLAILIGMLFSAGAIRRQGGRLTQLGVLACIGLAARQMFYVGAYIFAIMFINKDRTVSRMFLGTYLCGGVLLLALFHGSLPRLLAALIFTENKILRTAVVGHSSSLDYWLSHREHLGIKLVGFVSNSALPQMDVPGVPLLGPVAKLEEIIRTRRINQVILADPADDSDAVDRLIETCENEGCRFLMHNDYSSKYARHLISCEEDGTHFLALQQEPLEDPINRALKRVLDILISFPVVFFIIPPLTIIIWMVQRSQAPGPVFFNRPRGGRNRTTFGMFKYRSMYFGNHDITKQATSDDDRIYPLGRFLRKTSLDEFPQFINVLMGDMSVVGPRPHLPQHDEQFSKVARAYRTRSLVKPGITGLAQVKGFRGEITDLGKLRSRVYWDLYYVANWSVVMDIRIIWLTAWQVILPPKTAY